MKKNKNILLTILFMLLTQSIIFAADNPNDFGGYDLDENPLDKPKPPLPIDTNLWVLLLVGSLYGLSKCKTRNKTT